MENSRTNSSTGYSGVGQTTGGGAASYRNVDAQPQNRTLYWVIAGAILLSLIIWFATRNNDDGRRGQMDRQNSGQVAPDAASRR